jgi:hypothetical protein
MLFSSSWGAEMIAWGTCLGPTVLTISVVGLGISIVR